MADIIPMELDPLELQLAIRILAYLNSKNITFEMLRSIIRDYLDE